MKNFIFLLCGLFVALPAQAHVIAYQKWHNPTTGQVLEQFYDLHYPDADPTVNPLQLQQFLGHAQNLGNDTLVITEDMWSFDNKHILDFNDTSAENKALVEKHIRKYPSPRVLPWLYAECFIRNIPAFNAECRPDAEELSLSQEYSNEIANYDDNPILNNFYDSLEQYAQDLDDLEKDESFGFNFNYRMFAFDARILHKIYTTKASTILLAAGGMHMVSVNNILLQLGWIPDPLQLPTTLSSQERDSIHAWFVYPQTKEHATIIYNLFNRYDYNCPIIKDHALDLQNILQPSLWQNLIAFVRSIISSPVLISK